MCETARSKSPRFLERRLFRLIVLAVTLGKQLDCSETGVRSAGSKTEITEQLRPGRNLVRTSIGYAVATVPAGLQVSRGVQQGPSSPYRSFAPNIQPPWAASPFHNGLAG